MAKEDLYIAIATHRKTKNVVLWTGPEAGWQHMRSGIPVAMMPKKNCEELKTQVAITSSDLVFDVHVLPVRNWMRN